MTHVIRKLSESVIFSLAHNPVVFLNGPRQSGKSTLAQAILPRDLPADYVSFDSASHMAAAAAAPEDFLRRYNNAVVIDEVQIVPEIFRSLKLVVDELRLVDKPHSNGRFLLTGSANIMALPQLSDALVGRMSIKTLYPFSACEVLRTNGHFIESLFNSEFGSYAHYTSLNDVIRAATFPEISGEKSRIRDEWFDGYLTTILQRDVRMISDVEKITTLPVILRVLATRAGNLLNDADIARDVGLNAVTSKHYRSILQAMFLHFTVPPWYRNIGKRLVKSSKGYLIDSLLLCHLLEWNLDDLQNRRPELYGHVIENFVATELLKLLSFSEIRAKLLHFRTSDHKEVDFVLERPDGRLVGIEVKTSNRISIHDFKGMEVLRDSTKEDFICGVILYAGKDVLPFGDRFYAVPIAALWQ